MAGERLTDDELARLIEMARVDAAHEALGPNVYAAYWAERRLRALLELRERRVHEAKLQTFADQNITVSMVVEEPEETED